MNAVQRSCLLLTLLIIGGMMLASTCHSEDQFVINRSESELDSRYQYTYDLLALVIEATHADFGEGSLVVADTRMSRNRIFRSLKGGEGVNVIAEAPQLEWNQELIPIKIPIRKGIQGFRLFIIKKDNIRTLANVSTLAQLMVLKTGSGSQWSTKFAMTKAGFDVVESTQYETLFNMLSKDRFITFGRGVNEVFQELSLFKPLYPELVVDEHVLLHIPLATYYYVSPNKPRLAQRIEVGLKRIIANGQFDQLFYQHHCEFLLNAKLYNRLIFKIDNPYISEAEITSVVGKDFLLDPKDDFEALCLQYQ